MCLCLRLTGLSTDVFLLGYRVDCGSDEISQCGFSEEKLVAVLLGSSSLVRFSFVSLMNVLFWGRVVHRSWESRRTSGTKSYMYMC